MKKLTAQIAFFCILGFQPSVASNVCVEVVQSEKSVIEFPASKTTSKDDPPVPDHETSSN